MLGDTKFQPDRVIAAFGRVAAAIAAGRRRNEVLQLIASSVRDLVDGDRATVILPARDGYLLTVAADGIDAHVFRGQVYPAEGTSTQRVLRTGETLVVDNLTEDPVVGPRLNGLPIGPIAFVPVTIDGPYGVLSVSRTLGRPQFSQTDLDGIACFAAQSALVIENDCRRRRNISLDRVADQARIAAELQDTAISEIFSASLTMSRLANSSDPEAAELAVHAISSLDNAIKLIRQAIFGMKETRLGPEDDA